MRAAASCTRHGPPVAWFGRTGRIPPRVQGPAMTAVSVLMPVYNAAPFLSEAIASVLEYGGDLELIACDNGSTDSSWEVLREAASQDERVKLIRNEKNIGGVRNANRCLAEARCAHAMFMSADDVLAPGALRALIQRAAIERDVPLIFGEYRAFVGPVPTATPVEGRLWERLEWPASLARMLRGGNPVPFSSALFRMADARSTGGITEGRQYSADYRFWLGLALTAPIAHLDEVVMLYRMHGDSDSSTLTDPIRNRLEIHVAKVEALAALPPTLRLRMLGAHGPRVLQVLAKATARAGAACRTHPDLSLAAARALGLMLLPRTNAREASR